MSQNSYDTVRSLAAAATLRRSIVDHLRVDYEKLRSATVIPGEPPVSSSEASRLSGTGASSLPSPPSGGTSSCSGEDKKDHWSPLQMPVLSLVDSASGKSVLDVEPHEVGNVCVELEVCANAFDYHARAEGRVVDELELCARKSGERRNQLTEQIDLIRQCTGLYAKTGRYSGEAGEGKNSRGMTAEQREAFQRVEKRLTDPAHLTYAMNTPEVISGTKGEEAVRQENESLRRKIFETKICAKHIRDRIETHRQTLVAVEKYLKEKEMREAQIVECYNKIKRVDGDIVEAQRRLDEHVSETSKADATLLAASTVTADSTKTLDSALGDAIAKLKTIKKEELPIQERILKAQEFRLHTLQRRLRAVQAAVSTSGLERDLQVALEAAHAAREAAGPAAAPPSVSDADRDNIDLILPAAEKVHPALYSLIADEQETIRKRTKALRLLLAERAECYHCMEEAAEAAGETAEAAETAQRQILKGYKEDVKNHMAADTLTAERKALQEALRERNQLHSVLEEKYREIEKKALLSKSKSARERRI